MYFKIDHIGQIVHPNCFQKDEGWEIKEFVSVGLNPVYKVLLEHVKTKERIALENLPYNFKNMK